MSEPIPLGKLIEGEAERDAVHVAIVPVTAKEDVWPGCEVGIDGARNAPYVGIVDPFLKDGVKAGQRFYICLFPNSVTGMRHHWEHPLFDGRDRLPTQKQVADVVAVAQSRKWMEAYAACHYSVNDEYYGGLGRHYTADEVIEHAKDYLRTGDKHVQQGADSLRDNTNSEEFWHHFQILTGISVPDNEIEEVPFCCTC